MEKKRYVKRLNKRTKMKKDSIQRERGERIYNEKEKEKL